jgi:hypothetical protein
LSEQNRLKAKKFALEMLEKEILYMKGRRREDAMSAYRIILSAFGDAPMYFARS